MLPVMLLLLVPSIMSGERTVADERSSNFYNYIFRVDDFGLTPDVICHPDTECTGVDYLTKVLFNLPTQAQGLEDTVSTHFNRLSETVQSFAGDLTDKGKEVLQPDFMQNNGVSVQDPFQALSQFLNAQGESRDKGLPLEEMVDKERGSNIADTFQKLKEFVDSRREDSGDAPLPPEESDKGLSNSFPPQGVDNNFGNDIFPPERLDNNFGNDVSLPESFNNEVLPPDGSDSNPEWFSSTQSPDTLLEETSDKQPTNRKDVEKDGGTYFDSTFTEETILNDVASPQEQSTNEKDVETYFDNAFTDETILNDVAQDEGLKGKNEDHDSHEDAEDKGAVSEDGDNLAAKREDDGVVVNEDEEEKDQNDLPENIAQLMDEATIFDIEIFGKVYGKFALECTSSTANSSKLEDVPSSIFRAIDLAYNDFLHKFT